MLGAELLGRCVFPRDGVLHVLFERVAGVLRCEGANDPLFTRVLPAFPGATLPGRL